MNDRMLSPWPAIHTGDTALIRERDTARELAVTVVALLDLTEGEGEGFIDHRGRVIRHHFYDARPIAHDSASVDQTDVDDRFTRITASLTDTRTR